jgi:hypothetical protein
MMYASSPHVRAACAWWATHFTDVATGKAVKLDPADVKAFESRLAYEIVTCWRQHSWDADAVTDVEMGSLDWRIDTAILAAGLRAHDIAVTSDAQMIISECDVRVRVGEDAPWEQIAVSEAARA